MAGGYSVLNALNRNTRQQAEEKPCGRFRTKDIDIAEIYPNGHNFYAMQDIEALAADIKAVGLLENLTVMYAPTEKGSYKLLGGERRWRALRLLRENGYTEFATATCQIRTAENERAEMLEIIMCNRQRVKTVWEQIEEEKRLKETLQEMKKNKEPLKGYDLQDGRLRDTIAAILNYSAAKVGQMETIAKRLNVELYEALKEEKINFSAAYTVAKMDDAAQQEALRVYKETGSLNSAQAKEATAKEPEAERPEAQQSYTADQMGADQMNVESICYHCKNWDSCYQKSATTIRCKTFVDKAEAQKAEAKQQPQMAQQEPQETPQPRIIDSSTGEVYENMPTAQKAAESHTEPHREEPEAKVEEKTNIEHELTLPAEYFNDVATGKKPFDVRKNDRDYKEGDLLILHEINGKRATGGVIRCRVTYVLENCIGLAVGYCVLGIRVTDATYARG